MMASSRKATKPPSGPVAAYPPRMQSAGKDQRATRRASMGSFHHCSGIGHIRYSVAQAEAYATGGSGLQPAVHYHDIQAGVTGRIGRPWAARYAFASAIV